MKTSFFKKASLALTGLVAALTLSTSVVSAIPYDGAQTNASPVPAFNVFTGVPSYGDESDFLRARAPQNNDLNDGSTKYVDPLNTTCADGQKLQLRVYVHNGATKDNNNNGTGTSVIHGAKVKVSLPADTSSQPSATLSADNAATVTDTATINCGGKTFKVHYVAGSASQYSDGTSSVTQLPDSIVTTGAPIQSQTVAGDVWGCWEQRVYVILAVQLEEEKPAPVLQCVVTAFDVDTKKRAATITVTPKVTNATISGYSVDWNDGTVASKQTSDSSFTASHTYASDTENASVTASFTVTGSDTPVSGADCVKAVSFTKTPPVTPPTTPPVRPAAAKVLPNTGAGSIMTLFALTSIAGAYAHRRFLGRRVSN